MSQARWCILVVDDEPAIREALRDLLQDEGYLVRCACNGQDALAQLLRMPRPALILLDLTMPVLDGWAFCAERSRHAHLSSIPVIVLSADERLPAMAPELGVSAVLRKPPRIDRLLSLVGQHCTTT